MKPSSSQSMSSGDPELPHLPQELQEQIIIALGEDQPTLANCALVSHRWLHYSRTQLFATRCVDLSIDERHSGIYTFLESSFTPDKENVDGNGRKCWGISTLGPYIQQLRFRATTIRTVLPHKVETFNREIPNQMIRHALLQCPNLRELTLKKFKWEDLSPESVDIIRSLPLLGTITFQGVKFTHDELVTTLGGLQPSITSCHLHHCGIRIRGHLKYESHLSIPSGPPHLFECSAKLHLALHKLGESSIADFLLWARGLNVCSLHFSSLEPTDLHLKLQSKLIRRYSSTLVNIGTCLGQFHTDGSTLTSVDRPNHIPLHELYNLQSLDVGVMRLPSYPYPQRSTTSSELSPRGWLAQLIRTLPSSSSAFSRLAFGLIPSFYRGHPGQANTTTFSYHISNFNWSLLEDELMNPTRFSSGPPLVEITLFRARIPTRVVGENEKREVAVRREMQGMEGYLARVHRAGKLRITASD